MCYHLLTRSVYLQAEIYLVTGFSHSSAAANAVWHYQYVSTPSCCGWTPGSHRGFHPGDMKEFRGHRGHRESSFPLSAGGEEWFEVQDPSDTIITLHHGSPPPPSPGRKTNLWDVSIKDPWPTHWLCGGECVCPCCPYQTVNPEAYSVQICS